MMGIEFLGKHSYRDFGLTLAPGKEIGHPSKEKIKEKVAFATKEYDFSRLYGMQSFTTRSLYYPFNVVDTGHLTKSRMNLIKTKVVNWLMNSSGQQRLYDDAYPGYYFLAEVEDEASFTENYADGVLGITFTAYAFMTDELEEGHDIWDEINFELDVLQPTEFEIRGSQEITLINAGTPEVFPTIETTSEMELVKDNRRYSIQTGTTESKSFALKSGENRITIEGNGTVKFRFHKELI